MRFSLLAVIAVAVIIGLAVVLVVKGLGLFRPPEPPPTSAVQKQAEPLPKVLVASYALFTTDTVWTQDVKVRTLLPEEKADYEAHKADYLPPTPSVAWFRTPNRNIMADQPLKQGDLAEAVKPESLHARLIANARPITVLIPKELSVSGLVQVGDWVDVHVITEVTRSDTQNKEIHSGLLVRAAEVVSKRDTLYVPSYYGPHPAGPIPFTLAMNPYRAQLVEYARTVGSLTISPVSSEEKVKLDAIKKGAFTDKAKADRLLYGDPMWPDYGEEVVRVKNHSAGATGVGGADMARVLNLSPLQPPYTMQIIHGVTPKPSVSFQTGMLTPYYQFQQPKPPEGNQPPKPQSGNVPPRQ